MKKLIITGFFALIATAGIAQKEKHVVLISIDGMRPEFYLDKSWNTPNLQKLKEQGSYAEAVQSVFPSVTYPSHTTIITGAYPATHGIFYNVPYGAPRGQWYWEESLIKTTTLWDAVKKANLTSGAVMWPVTVGAPINYNFPVKRADDDDKIDQLSVTRPVVTPANLLDDMQKSIGKLDKADFNTNNTIDFTIGKMANYIIKNHKPNLMAIHFTTVDHLEHAHGRDAVQVKEAVAKVDSVIGTVVKTVKDAGLERSTVFIITGDHGMIDTKLTFSPNVLLSQGGLISENTWKAKFHIAGGSAFLYLKDKNDQSTLKKVKEIMNNAPENLKKYYRVVDRMEMDKIGANPDAAMALAFTKGVTGTGDTNGEALKKMKSVKGNHGYYPTLDEVKTGFIISGAGVNGGQIVKEMGIKDVAPLISKILNLDFRAKDGVLIPDLLK